MGIKEAFANMSDDFKAKAKDIKTVEEFEALLKEEKIELTPEQVEALAGAGQGTNQCPFFSCPLNY